MIRIIKVIAEGIIGAILGMGLLWLALPEGLNLDRFPSASAVAECLKPWCE